MNRRHRVKSPAKKSRCRFIRIESLEPRIVLDGSAELGIITPDQNAVIDFDGTAYFSSDNTAGINSLGADLFDYTNSRNSGLTESTQSLGGLDLLVSGDSAIFYQAPDLGTRDAVTKIGSVVNNSFVAGNTGLVATATAMYELQLKVNESRSQFDIDGADSIGDVSVVTDGVRGTSDRAIDDSLEWEIESKSRLEDTVRLERILSTDREFKLNGIVANDQISLEDPIVIEPPLAANGLLPIESSSRPDIGSIARTQSENASETATSLATAQASEVKDVTSSERVAASETGGRDAATSQQAVAISQDRYFVVNANHVRRTHVAWSTHSAASESREHVLQTSATDRIALNPTRDRVESRSESVVMRSRSDASRGVSDMLMTARMRAVRSTIEMLVSTVSSMTADTNLVALARATNGSPAVGEESPPTDANVTSPASAGEVRDMLFAKYQPLSVLVGASLVSAHLIADAQTAKVKRPVRLASRRQRSSSTR